jgi:hypothetical protein
MMGPPGRGEILVGEALYNPDWDDVKENLILEGLRDWISFGWVHNQFLGQDPTQTPPVPQIQQRTLRMVRELVGEGLFVLGIPKPSKADPAGFDEWDVPLDEAMAKIEKTYIGNYDDWKSWYFVVSMDLTAKGEKLALEIYGQDYPEGPAWPGWKPRFN